MYDKSTTPVYFGDVGVEVRLESVLVYHKGTWVARVSLKQTRQHRVLVFRVGHGLTEDQINQVCTTAENLMWISSHKNHTLPT